jgi:hypothetical protein
MYISNEGILVILFVGLVAGWLAGKIVHGTGFGFWRYRGRHRRPHRGLFQSSSAWQRWCRKSSIQPWAQSSCSDRVLVRWRFQRHNLQFQETELVRRASGAFGLRRGRRRTTVKELFVTHL